uniref:Uncharacterized protein n=1 Tax=Rhizophora mucronata TaxID=61149 RepID=A0A2P2NX91_RHIMU
MLLSCAILWNFPLINQILTNNLN